MWWLNTTVQTISNCGTKLVLTGRPWAVFLPSRIVKFYEKLHMGEISQGVQSLNLMSYLLGVLGPFFGDLGLCYGKN